jgi:2-oxoglutarate dehydrogenase E2 component (dihydrolipoamide succinyltransferase)
MAVDIKVPSVGESITEGRIARWLKPEGSAVRVDESVCELETDKASAEISAPATGILKYGAKEGDVVAIGAVIGSIDPAGVAGATATPAAVAPQATAATPSKEVLLSPAARVAVESSNVNPTTLVGTGRGGRVIKEDVLVKPTTAVVPAPAATQTVANAQPPRVIATNGTPRETRVKMTGIRQRIAERLVESQQSTATLTTFNEADMSGIMAIREKYKDKFKEKHGVGLGFMSFFVKAAVEALKAFPNVNARIDGQEVVHQHFYDIGVAVSTERGLMVPIVRDADQLSFAAIEKKIGELAVKARDGKISVGDLQGGTFTITNGGVFGSMLSTPILNPPQTGILGMHATQKRAVVVNDQIVIRPMMYLALSYDHRLIDGRDAVQFLVRMKEGVENPERLMLEV